MALIKFKRGPSSNITSLVLTEGEPAFTTDTKKLYVGDGAGGKILINQDGGVAETAAKLSTARNFSISGDGTAPNIAFDGSGNVALALTLKNSGATAGTYTKLTINAKGLVIAAEQLTASDIPTLTLRKISDAGTAAGKNTGIASGNIPVLDSSGKLPESVIPAVAITDIFEVSSQAAMLAVTGADVGDVAVRSDESKSYILKTAPASTLSNWVELKTPTNTVLSVNGQTGAVTITDITGNAATATKLKTARTINGVSFDGSANITITDSTKEPVIAAGSSGQYYDGTKAWKDLAGAVRSIVLSGLSTATNSAILATDTILMALGKLQGQLNAKANLASPALTGTPTAPTAAATTNNTQIATTAFVKSQGYLSSDSVIDGGTF